MTASAIEYVRSVPRYLTTRALARRWPAIGVSPFGVVRLVEHEPPPLPSTRWVRVEPILSGICGSDLATITAQGSTYFSPFTSTPFVFGHEVVGLVTEVGERVERVSAGERVCLAPPLHCAIREIDEPCVACRTGDIAHCRYIDRGVIGAGIQTGYCRDTGGGWSRGFVAHERQLFSVPAELDDEAAVLVEPLSCCLNAVQQAPLEHASTVLVLGCGTIGALTIVSLRDSGYVDELVVVAKYEQQRELAARLGATHVIGTGSRMRTELAAALDADLRRPEIGPPTAVGGADVTFDCVGSGNTLDDALRFTRSRGTVIVVGMPGVPSGIDWTSMWHKELVIRGSYTADDATFDRAMGVALGWRDRIAPLVGPRYSLADFREAIECALESGRRGRTKVVFDPRA